MDGGYTNWTKWSPCSVTCGGGTKHMTRNCTNPEPQYGGKDCLTQGLGPATSEASCNPTCCPGIYIILFLIVRRLKL